jgi:hypothetical protein
MDRDLILGVLACLLFVAFGVLILWDITKKFTTIKHFPKAIIMNCTEQELFRFF